MTITTTVAENIYAGSGSTGPFAFNYKIFAISHLDVYTTDPNGVQTQLNWPADFSVSANATGAKSGGSITLTNALLTGWQLTIARVVPDEQLTDFRNQGEFFPASYEDGLDYLTMITQQQDLSIERAIKVPTPPAPGTIRDTIADFEAGLYLRVALDGLGVEGVTAVVGDPGFIQSGTGAVVRTANAKMAESCFTPQDFGAKGDGSTNDNAAFTKWVAALNVAGGYGYIPPATYIVTTNFLFTHSNITIYGAGRSSIISATISANTYVFAAQGDGTIFRDFRVTGSHPGLYLSAGATVMNHCRIVNVEITGATVNNPQGFASGIFVAGHNDLIISDCLLYGNGSATGENHADIDCNFGTYQIVNSLITRNRCLSTLVNANIIAIDPFNLTISDNICSGAIVSPVSDLRQGYGICIYNAASHAFNALVGNCRIIGNTVSSVQGTGIYVQSIHHALVVGNTVDTTGADQADTSLSVAGIAIDSGSGSCPATVTGNTVRNSSKDGIQFSGVVGFVCTGNLVDLSAQSGISVRGVSTDGVIAGNTVMNIAANAIGMWSSNDFAALRITIAHNVIRTLTGSGASRGLYTTASTVDWSMFGNKVTNIGSNTAFVIAGTDHSFNLNTLDGAYATATPTPVLATGASHTVDDVITVLQALGLVKQS